MKLFASIVYSILILTSLNYAQGKIQKYNPFSGTIVFSVEAGATFASLDYAGLGFDYSGRASLEYFFPSSSKTGFGLRLFGSTGFLKGDDSNFEPASIRTSIANFGGGVIFILSINDEVFPYLYAGISNLWFGPKGEGGELLKNNRNGLYSTSEINYNIEAGTRFSVTSNLSLNILAGINISQNDWLDDIALGTVNDAYYTLMGGISYSFLSKSDYDGDGVIDSDDLCPDTPEGIRVDKTGCAVDSDNDGIPDYVDKCPHTPKKVRVDADGCALDSDNDGIPDYTDICPGTPAGVEVDDLGCAYDLDADGVPDYMDHCPGTPYDVDVDKTGCPVDSDEDGVPDYIDQCPGTLPGMQVDETGCEVVQDIPEPEVKVEVKPEPGFTEPTAGGEIVLYGENYFRVNDIELIPGSHLLLDKLVDVMKKYPMSRWRIEGHHSDAATEDDNLAISKLRADAVVEYFVIKGIPKGRLVSEGYGSSRPVTSSNSEAEKLKNDRVVVIRQN